MSKTHSPHLHLKLLSLMNLTYKAICPRTSQAQSAVHTYKRTNIINTEGHLTTRRSWQREVTNARLVFTLTLVDQRAVLDGP